MALFFLKNSSLFKNQSIQSSLLAMGIEFEFNELEKGLNFFNQIFQPIFQLEKGDKIGIQDFVSNNNLKYVDFTKINFNLYLDKYKIYQSLSRWYYKQNRKEIFEKMDLLIDTYFILIKRIKVLNANYTSKFETLFKNVISTNEILVTKLNILSETYGDPEITPIIKTYCDRLTEYPNYKDELSVSLPKYEDSNEKDLNSPTKSELSESTSTKQSDLHSSIESVKSDINEYSIESEKQ